MDCKDVRERLLDHQRGRLDAETSHNVAAHLAGCAGCRNAAAADAELSDVLAHKLPRHAASEELKARLAAELAARPPSAAPSRARSSRARSFIAPLASALAAAALVLVAVRWTQPQFLRDPAAARAALVDEGVDDHLRVVASAHPVEIESGGIHQVKPWFTGRLDFAPRVTFSGDDDFQLEGGAIGYFRDRKAAVFVWKHKLHTISLLVFRADGLPLTRRETAVSRGFNVLLWRDGELGYCLVSDADGPTLAALAGRIAAAP